MAANEARVCRRNPLVAWPLFTDREGLGLDLHERIAGRDNLAAVTAPGNQFAVACQRWSRSLLGLRGLHGFVLSVVKKAGPTKSLYRLASESTNPDAPRFAFKGPDGLGARIPGHAELTCRSLDHSPRGATGSPGSARIGTRRNRWPAGTPIAALHSGSESRSARAAPAASRFGAIGLILLDNEDEP